MNMNYIGFLLIELKLKKSFHLQYIYMIMYLYFARIVFF